MNTCNNIGSFLFNNPSSQIVDLDTYKEHKGPRAVIENASFRCRVTKRLKNQIWLRLRQNHSADSRDFCSIYAGSSREYIGYYELLTGADDDASINLKGSVVTAAVVVLRAVTIACGGNQR